MHRRILFVTTVCTTLAAAGAASEARAQGTRTITCESLAPYPGRCRVPEGSQVRLLEQISRSPCRENSTWGVRRDYVWVSDGCRARFAVYGGYGNGNGHDDDDSNPGRGHGYGRGHGHGHHDGWDRGDDDQGDGDRNRGGDSRDETGGPWNGGDKSWRVMQQRAQNACTRAASSWLTRVTGFGDWTQSRRGMLRADMYVRDRDHTQPRVMSCVYDPARDAATVSR